MTTTEHTPGPWVASFDAVPDWHTQATIIEESTGERVSIAFGSEANVRLIAAAPELFAALQRVADELRYVAGDNRADWDTATREAVILADNAIEKATNA